MSVNVSDVRSELQMPKQVISDDDVQYAIDKVELDDVNLVCAQVLRMLKAKYRGRIRYRIGKYTESIDVKTIDTLIRTYMTKSPVTEISGGVAADETDFLFDKDTP